MKYWIYTTSSAAADDLKMLKDAGFTGIMGSASLAAPALEAGLQVMLCGGAFPAYSGQEKDETDHLSTDINGQKQVWFYSCCPNHAPTRKKIWPCISRLPKRRESPAF